MAGLAWHNSAGALKHRASLESSLESSLLPSTFVGLDAGTQTSDGEKLLKKRQPTRKSPTRKSPTRAVEVEADTTAEDKQATKKVAPAVEEVPAEIKEALRELLGEIKDGHLSCAMLLGMPRGLV